MQRAPVSGRPIAASAIQRQHSATVLKSIEPGGTSPPAAPLDKNVARYSRVASDRHAQNYDRMEAIEALARIETSEAASALLRRFTFYIEPSITDQEEREVAFRELCTLCGVDSEPYLATRT